MLDDAAFVYVYRYSIHFNQRSNRKHQRYLSPQSSDPKGIPQCVLLLFFKDWLATHHFFFSLSSKGSEAIHFSSTMSKKVPTRTNEHLHHTVLDVQHEVSDEKLVTGIQYSDYASTV